MVLGLMALGSALVTWPLILLLKHQQERNAELAARIVQLKLALDRAVEQANVQVLGEQAIDAARDLPPLDELRVLLGPDGNPAPKPAPGNSGGSV